jgi:hypothetical protein
MNTQEQCPLFNLPAEIRLFIYEFALQRNDDPVDVNEIPYRHHLAVLQSCRRINHEAKTIFYAIHRFGFSNYLFKRVGPNRRNAITAVTITTSSGGAPHGCVTNLHKLPNLKSLYFQRDVSVRYLNISEWASMRRQIQSELAKLKSLEEVKIFTPEAKDLTPAEEQRMEKLRGIDAFLEFDRKIGPVDGGSL